MKYRSKKTGNMVSTHYAKRHPAMVEEVQIRPRTDKELRAYVSGYTSWIVVLKQHVNTSSRDE